MMDDLARQLAADGFAFAPAAMMAPLLGGAAALPDLAPFAASWDGLERDTYMADGGRYRSRRFAVFAARPGSAEILRAAHQPHYQSRDYNSLNGGIARWFAPILPEIGESACMRRILHTARALFDRLLPEAIWHIEVHQFRIEAARDMLGQPTPEGMHRDGVDYVLVLLIERQNIASGVTSIHDLEGVERGSFTLTTPLDAAWVHDQRVFHGVTAVQPLDPARPAHRDVLVVTFRRVEVR